MPKRLPAYFKESASSSWAFSAVVLFCIEAAALGGKAANLWVPLAALLSVALYHRLSLLTPASFSGTIAFPFVLAFLLWNVASLLWTLSLHDTFLCTLKLAAVAGFGVIVFECWGERHRRLFERIVVIAGIILAVGQVVPSLRDITANYLLPGNPQYSALWLCVAFFVVCHWLWQQNGSLPSRPIRLIWVGVLGLLFWALLMTTSRSGILALLAGLIFYFGHRHGWKIAFMAGAAAAAVILLLPRSMGSDIFKSYDPLSFQRFLIWKNALWGIIDRPLLGRGPGTFEALYLLNASPRAWLPTRFGNTSPFAHNDFLQIAAGVGLPAAFCVAAFAAVYIFQGGKEAILPRTIALIFLLFSLFNFPFFLPVNGLLFAGFVFSDRRKLEAGVLNAIQRLWHSMQRPVALLVGLFSAASLAFAAADPLFQLAGSDKRLYARSAEQLLTLADQRLHSSTNPSENDIKEAETLNRWVLKLNPAASWAWQGLSHIALDHQTPPDIPAALDSLKEALRWNPTHAPWQYELAILLARQGNNVGALEACHRALYLEPAYARPALMIGRIWLQEGYPEHGERWMASFLQRCQSRPAPTGAVSSYVREVCSVPADDFYVEIAQAQVNQGKYKAAMATLTRLADPRRPRAWLLKAQIYDAQGDRDRSEEALQQAIKLDPESADLKKIQQRFAGRNRRS